MKRRYALRGLRDYISDNKPYYLLVGISIVLGVIIGSVSAISMGADSYENLNKYINSFISVYNLQPVNKVGIFKTSFFNNIRLVSFLWVSGLWIGFIPFAILQMGIKGYKLGFSIAFFVQAYRGQGILFALMSLLPQILILIPALIIYTVFNMKYAISIRKLRIKKLNGAIRKEMYLRSFLCLVGTILVVALCSFFDAFVISALLKPICYFFNM